MNDGMVMNEREKSFSKMEKLGEAQVQRGKILQSVWAL